MLVTAKMKDTVDNTVLRMNELPVIHAPQLVSFIPGSSENRDVRERGISRLESGSCRSGLDSKLTS